MSGLLTCPNFKRLTELNLILYKRVGFNFATSKQLLILDVCHRKYLSPDRFQWTNQISPNGLKYIRSEIGRTKSPCCLVSLPILFGPVNIILTQKLTFLSLLSLCLLSSLSFLFWLSMALEAYASQNTDKIHTDVLLQARISCYKVHFFSIFLH